MRTQKMLSMESLEHRELMAVASGFETVQPVAEHSPDVVAEVSMVDAAPVAEIAAGKTDSASAQNSLNITMTDLVITSVQQQTPSDQQGTDSPLFTL